MQYDQGFIEQVRSSIGIVELISNYVNLKKSGQNHAGLCPFHGEKTPSFLVSEAKQIFKCFGCGQGGDVFKFISLIENLSFPESVRFLAERVGIPLPMGPKDAGKSEGERQALTKVMEIAADYFGRALESPSGFSAREYLADRQINEATIRRFGIGYAPSGNRLLEFLQEKGVGLTEAQVCGLIKQADGDRFYDNFRDRVMFPIRNLSGQAIAFGGRVLGQGVPKYLNSPETPLYNKSSNLFGLDVSRQAIREKGFAILVEGYFDCIVPYQEGFKNVVASLGTSLTSQQARVLRRYTENVVINFDPDSAGIAASVRSIEIFLKQGFRVNMVELPQGVDPDTYIRQSGAAEYQSRLTGSSACLSFLLERFIAEQNQPFSPKGKQEIIDRIVPFLLWMPDGIERAEYLARIASRMRVSEDQIRLELRKRPGREPRTESPRTRSLMRATWAESVILAAVMDPSWTEMALSLVDSDFFSGMATEGIFQKVYEMRKLNREINILYLRDLLSREEDRDLLESIGMQSSEIALSQDVLSESARVLRRKYLEALSREVQEELDREEAVNPSSPRIEELLTKKEELHKKIALELQ